jgi:hypothetical protein
VEVVVRRLYTGLERVERIYEQVNSECGECPGLYLGLAYCNGSHLRSNTHQPYVSVCVRRHVRPLGLDQLVGENADYSDDDNEAKAL